VQTLFTCKNPVPNAKKSVCWQRSRRPRKVEVDDACHAAKARQLRENGIAAADIAKMLGGSRATVYRYLSEGVSLSAERLGPAVG
jgi:DNA invertase Pin-like site-specific DNA recombinase